MLINMHLLVTELYNLFRLRSQQVPRSKHFPSQLQKPVKSVKGKSRWFFFFPIARSTNTLCGKNLELFNVKHDGNKQTARLERCELVPEFHITSLGVSREAIE